MRGKGRYRHRSLPLISPSLLKQAAQMPSPQFKVAAASVLSALSSAVPSLPSFPV